MAVQLKYYKVLDTFQNSWRRMLNVSVYIGEINDHAFVPKKGAFEYSNAGPRHNRFGSHGVPGSDERHIPAISPSVVLPA